MQNRIGRYGRMPRRAATDLARVVHNRMVENARRGGARYDTMRQVLGGVLFDGPGANRAEYDERLQAVIVRLGQGLTEENLEALFSSDVGALRCAELFGVTMGQCDALIAAAARQNADIPYLPPDDGATVRAELTEAGVSAPLADAIVRGLSTTLLSVPASIDRSERGQRIGRLITSCPRSLPDRESRVRSWHLGPTSALARCIGLSIGREGRTAPNVAQSVLGLSAEAAVPFLRWAHRQPVQEQRRGPSRNELMSAATGHYRAGRFAEAARAYQAVIALDASFAPAHQGLAVSRLRAGDAAGAAQAYRGAARLLPSSPEVQVGLARALRQAGDRQGAIAAYRAALALAPGREDATRELSQLDGSAELQQLREQARAHFAARRFAEAERTYARLTQLAPQDAAVYAGRGASLLALGRRPDAVGAYRRATELAPTNAGFFAALGAAQEASGDTAAARTSYQRALTIDPNQRAATQGIARVSAPPSAPARPSSTPPAIAQTPAPVRAQNTPASQSPPARPQSTPAATPPPAARAQNTPPASPTPSRTAPPNAPARPQPTPVASRPTSTPAAPARGPNGAPLPEFVTRDELVRALAPLEHRLEECAPRIDATVSFRLRIRGTDGGVAEANVLGDLAGTSEATCMEGHLAQAHFPRFSRSEMEVTYPFELRGRLAPSSRPR